MERYVMYDNMTNDLKNGIQQRIARTTQTELSLEAIEVSKKITKQNMRYRTVNHISSRMHIHIYSFLLFCFAANREQRTRLKHPIIRNPVTIARMGEHVNHSSNTHNIALLPRAYELWHT